MIFQRLVFFATTFVGALAGPHASQFAAVADTPAQLELGVLKSSGVRHVTATEASQLLESDPNIVVVDVRTPREFAESHIEGAVNIDYFADDFAEQVSALDKQTIYLIHCRSGRRSGKAAPIMQAAGIVTIVHMDGGFKAWLAAGLPFVEG